MNGINNMTDNEGLTNPVDYQVDAFVDQLDRNGNTIKSYTLRGVFPTQIAAIALDYTAKADLQETSVTLAFQYFESNTTT
jgi:autotransporter translocation and assembly factor TamB